MKVKCKSLKAFKIEINGQMCSFDEGATMALEQHDADIMVRNGLMIIVPDAPQFAAVKIVGKPKVSKKAVKRDNDK